MVELIDYHGSCHCGAVSFTLNCPPINTACHCNCSICRRKNALMSDTYYESPSFRLVSGEDSLRCYQFGDKDVNHYFCQTCGVYPFHDGTGDYQGKYRVNLGCIEGLELTALRVREIDGASF